jgi:hypothetical protein
MNFKLSWITLLGFLVMERISIFRMMNGVEPLFLLNSTFLIMSVKDFLLQSVTSFIMVPGVFPHSWLLHFQISSPLSLK